ncbi:unnamed protein product, partial [marine sediment metagenome]
LGYSGDAPDITFTVPRPCMKKMRKYTHKRMKNICINNGGLFKHKKFSKSKLVELIKALDKYRIILVGGPKEASFRSITHKNLINLTGALSIHETAAILKQCDLVISTDSGIMHIADAVGTPVITLWGPTLIEKNYPWHNRDNIITANLPCAPCWWTSAQAACISNKCMQAIEIQTVVDKVHQLLPNISSLNLTARKDTTTIITTYNRPHLLQQCLESINQTNSRKDTYIIAVGDGIEPTTRKLLRNSNCVDDFIFLNERRGISFGVNIGLEVAKFNNSKFVNYIQDDVVVKDKNWLNIMLDVWLTYHKSHKLKCLSGFLYPIDTNY